VEWERECEAGVDTSFVVDDVLVGNRSEHFHALDLDTSEFLWKVPQSTAKALVSDGSGVILAEDDVTCYDLRTGALRWRRPGSDFGNRPGLDPALGKAYQMGFIWRDCFFVRIGEPLLLTALEVKTGKTVWRTSFPVQWCEPYDGRAYGIEAKGMYRILDLAKGHTVFENAVADVPPVSGPKRGLMVGKASDAWPWRGSTVAVSETHAFVAKPSGQIVVLGRETGEVEQVVEIDGMPASHEPIIYDNHLLLTDFNAAVYCFRGAE
jgi:hypothetical protein